MGGSVDDIDHDEWLESRFPPGVLNSLTEEQRVALGTVMRETSWKSHPVDIRMSMPWVGRRIFLTIVGGMERRSSDRIKHEKTARPVRTMGNILFILGIAALFYMLAVFGIFFSSNVLEF
ncbi:MAG: hypothetical protein A2516_04870 [Alphaproteobacteria bacterium RIFOXYD12_FULL_60_8]|nr:MAG: hypothetical protein A2516_04870 [Alphaproteobacteria bacterium RIFOXYD12_FULL_60_8]